MKFCLVLWTCKNLEEARRIARDLLEKRLVACASMIPSVESVFRWEGSIQEAEECKVFLKTEERHVEAICREILSQGSYEVPEILQVPVEWGNPAYLSWAVHEIHV